MATTMLLSAIFLATLALQATSLLLPATGKLPNIKLLAQACAGVPDGLTVCYPYSSSKYIFCGMQEAGKPMFNKIKNCKTGTVYDYGLRTCVPKAFAKTCPGWSCPAPGKYSPGSNGVSQFLAPFGTTGNITIQISDTAGPTNYFCPTIGHCTLGMVLKIVSLGVAPENRPAQMILVDFEEMTKDSDLYPTRIHDVVGYAGDHVTLWWDEPIHTVATFNPLAADASLVVPYPPQPHYKCPEWQVVSGTATSLVMSKLPGEIRLMEVMTATGGHYNLTVNSTHDGMFVACQLTGHCRNGMIFKIRIVLTAPSAAARTPTVHPINWILGDYDNFPDITVFSGDILAFSFPPAKFGAQGPDITVLQPHGITLLPAELVRPYVASVYPPSAF